MGALTVQWEIALVIVGGVSAVIAWFIYAYKNNKLSAKPILKQNGNEPLATSPVLKLKYFLSLRLLLTIYALSAWVAGAIHFFPYTFSFYTVWNYTALCFYFLSASIFSFITYISENGIPDSQYFNYYRVFVWIIFQCECSLSLLVDLTVWCILAPASGNPLNFISYNSVSMHLLNVVFIYIDLSLNSVPIHYHFGFCAIAPPLVYTLFSWLYYEEESIWDYFFMDSSKLVDAIWLSVIFLMHLFSWTVAWKIAQWKQNYYKKKQQLTYNVAINESNNNQNTMAMTGADASFLGVEAIHTDNP